jgi:hypothetical protein
MKKPNWKLNFNKFKVWYWKPIFIKQPLCWKQKHNFIRVEICPCYSITWGYWEICIRQGTDEQWEFYIYCTEYCNNDVQKAIDTWPWGKNINGKWVRTNPLK